MKLPVKGRSLAAVRKARGYTEADVASALRLDVDRIRKIESETEQPTKGIVTGLAELFFVPLSVFFATEISPPKSITDFRTARNLPARVGKTGLKQISQCTELQDVLFELIPKLGLSFFSTNIRLRADDDVEEASDRVANFLNLESYGFFRETEPRQLFLIARRAIEKKKISVLMHRLPSESFRGFCLSENQQVPIIFINSFEQTDKTKLFTLVHELVHVFIRRDGVSDPFDSDTRVERFCNGVAARVLMPERPFRQLYREYETTTDPLTLTRLISDRIGLSLNAIALRIDELGLRNSFYSTWQAAVSGRYRNASLRMLEEGQGDLDADDEEVEFRGRPSGARRLLNRFGYRLALIFDLAVKRNLLSAQDGDRLAGVSATHLDRASQFAEQEFGKDI